MATKVKMTQMFQIFVFFPPRGMKMYLMSHWLNPLCQLRQKFS